jgi:hypothetical protein
MTYLQRTLSDLTIIRDKIKNSFWRRMFSRKKLNLLDYLIKLVSSPQYQKKMESDPQFLEFMSKYDGCLVFILV